MSISFSIIMPTFNRKNCIKNAIDSLLCQTYQNFELIIVDDGSEDGTEDYLKKLYQKELEDKKIIYILLSENKGAAFARNEGLRRAKNNWIGYLDTDNKMRKKFLDTFVSAIESNLNNKVFYAKFKKINSKQVVGHKFNLEELISGNFIDLGVFVHSIELYKKLGGFDVNLKRLIDWDLVIRYTEKYEPVFLENVLLDYYDGSDLSRISNNNKHDDTYKEIILNYYERLPSTKFIEANKKHLERKLLLEESGKTLAEKVSEINKLITKIIKKDNNIKRLENEINDIKNSKFWKIRNVIIKIRIKLGLTKGWSNEKKN